MPAGTARTLVGGLARLVEGQRCFAEEFGLAYGRVFTGEYEAFKNRRAEEVLREWLTDAEAGVEHLQSLLDDLLQHQLALVEALEGVAAEAISQLSPEQVEKTTPGLFGIRPLAWRSYRALHGEFVSNTHLRHQKLILNGFVNGYVKARGKKRAARPGGPSKVEGGSQP